MGKGKCVICGKDLGFLTRRVKWNSERRLRWNKNLKRYDIIYYRQDLHEKWLCWKCYNNLIDAEPSCYKCAFYREIDRIHGVGGDIDTLRERRCGKFDFEIVSPEYNQAKICSEYINIAEYKQKVLKGEIAPSASKAILKTCQYCGTQFNLTETPTCPKCGA
jgi:hypothetical protein